VTEPSEFGIEAPLPDAVDQHREQIPATDQDLEPIEHIPPDANEADVVDQHRVVPVDDELMGRAD
jgi:hypothetical protein